MAGGKIRRGRGSIRSSTASAMCSAITGALRARCWSARTARPCGGWLDGALGVVYGLEAARRLERRSVPRRGRRRNRRLGRRGGALRQDVGSRSFTGTLGDDEIASATPRRQKLSRGRSRVCRQNTHRLRQAAPSRLWHFEAHIEQGGTLEATGRRIRHRRARTYSATGTTGSESPASRNHAGTNEMHRRRSAAAALVRLAARIRLFCGNRPRTEQFAHGMDDRPHPDRPERASIVPGRAEMQVQFRDTDSPDLARFEQALHELTRSAPDPAPSRSRRSRKASRPIWTQAFSARSRERPSVTRRACTADAERRRVRPGPAGCARRRCSCRASRASAITGPRIRARRTARRAGLRRRRGRDPESGVSDMAVVIQESLRAAVGPLLLDAALGALCQCALAGAGRPRGCSMRRPRSPGGPMRVNQMYEERPDCDLVCFAEAVTTTCSADRTHPEPDFRMELLRQARIGTLSEAPTPGSVCRKTYAAPASIPRR